MTSEELPSLYCICEAIFRCMNPEVTLYLFSVINLRIQTAAVWCMSANKHKDYCA